MSAWKIGGQPPVGYVDWHEWAKAHNDAGIFQAQCPRCKLWFFPQESRKHGTCEVLPDGEKEKST